MHGKRAVASQRFLRCISQGKTSATTSIFVLSEIAWFLLRFGRSKHQVGAYLKELDMKGLKLVEGDILPLILLLYQHSRLDWIDCVVAVLAQQAGCTSIMTYDQAFDQVEWLSRREP